MQISCAGCTKICPRELDGLVAWFLDPSGLPAFTLLWLRNPVSDDAPEEQTSSWQERLVLYSRRIQEGS